MQSVEAADAVQADGDQQDGHDENEQALDGVGDGGGAKAAEDDVDSDDGGIGDIEGKGVDVGDEGLKLAVLILVVEDLKTFGLGEGSLAEFDLGFEGLIF